MKKLYSLILLIISFHMFGQNYLISNYNTSNSTIGSNTINDIKATNNGTLYLATTNGLVAMSNDNFTRYSTSNTSIGSNNLVKLATHINNVWATTSQNGLIYRNGTTGAFTNYTYSQNGLPSNVVNDIAVDSNGILWAATTSGLARFNGTTWTIYNTNNSQMWNNNVTSVFINSSNVVYFTAGSVLSKVVNNQIAIVTDGAEKIVAITGSTIYVTTQDGITKYTNEQIDTFIEPSNTCLLSCNINAMSINTSNEIWLGASSCGNYLGGLQKFNDCQTIRTSNSTLPDNNIISVFTKSQDVIWAGTSNNGLVKLTRTTTICNPPTSLAVNLESIGTTYANLTWSPANPTTTGYLYSYSTNNSRPILSHSTNTTNAWVSNLLSNTTYYWWAFSTCSSTWVSGPPFTTLSEQNTCVNPTQLHTTNITTNSATINWIAPSPAPEYGYLYQYSTTYSENPSSYLSTNGTSKNLTNLQPGTTYHYWVGTFCEPFSWAYGGTFTTTSNIGICGAPTNILASNITSNSCKLSWSASGSNPSSYDLYISTNPTNPTASTEAMGNTQNTSYDVIYDLAPNTTYYFWLRSVCGSTKGAWSAVTAFTTNPHYACNGANNGLYPQTLFVPLYNIPNQLITNQAYAGEYCNVNIIPGEQYVFTSSISTDFITITNAQGNNVLASGTSPLSWTATSGTTSVRYFIHSNSQCGDQSVLRSRYISRLTSDCLQPLGFELTGVTPTTLSVTWLPTINNSATSYDLVVTQSFSLPNASVVPTFTNITTHTADFINLTPYTDYYVYIRSNCGSTKSNWWGPVLATTPSIVYCTNAPYHQFPPHVYYPTSCSGVNEAIIINAYAGEYSLVGVDANKNYKFTSQNAQDFVTITNQNGTSVYASGQSPVTWSSTSSETIRYYLHKNSNCEIEGLDRIKYISCSNPTTFCGDVTNIVISNINRQSVDISWTSPTTGADYYDVYYSTSNTVPTANTNPTTLTYYTSVSINANLDANRTYNVWVRSKCGSNSSNWISGGAFTTLSTSNCTSSNALLYPSAVFNPLCTQEFETIATDSQDGEYSLVTVQKYKTYSFSSSNPQDYITITNNQNTQVLAAGTSPVAYFVLQAEDVRFYIHQNANCELDYEYRTKYVRCWHNTACISNPHGQSPAATFTPNCQSSTPQLITYQAPGKFAKINIQAGRIYTFSTTTASFLTIETDNSLDILTSGTSPLIWNSGDFSGVVRYHLHADDDCTTTGPSTNLYVSCAMPTQDTTCGNPSNFIVRAVSANSANITWNAASGNVDYYGIYVSTNSQTPSANTNQNYSSNYNHIVVNSNLSPNTTYHYWVRSICGQSNAPWQYGGSFTTTVQLICNTAYNGLYPTNILIPTNTTARQLLNNTSKHGQYLMMQVKPNSSYTFSTNVGSDYITITNQAGSVIYAAGGTEVQWNSGNSTEIVRYYIHANNNCYDNNVTNRSKFVKLGALSTDDNVLQESLQIYPNPTTGSFTVDTGSIIADAIEVYDQLGRMIKTHKPTQVSTTLSLDQFASGMYLIKVNHNENTTTKKLMLLQ